MTHHATPRAAADATADADANHLQQYVADVRKVHEKFSLITAGKHDIVRNLNRAAQSLRTMANIQRPKRSAA